ncbi:hypothetical protein F5Y08DRAFT_149456 [Xylaria arbuscula]|nr:hypothetical protein F5Y08DRAFT_149456 [Xylaria arbuscula]
MENRNEHEVLDLTGLPRPDRTGLHGYDMSLVNNKKQPQVIVLDDDSPVQAQHGNDEISCKNHILLIFPDICPDYLEEVSRIHCYKIDAVSSAILDKLETDGNYPTRPAAQPPSRKRKRLGGCNEPGDDPYYDSDEEGEDCDPDFVRAIKLQIATREHAAKMALPEYGNLAKVLITQDFPRVPQQTIRDLLQQHQMSVFETYTAMDDKQRNWDEANMPWKENKRNSKIRQDFKPERLPSLDLSTYKPGERAAFTEFFAARELRSVKDAKLGAKIFASEEEENNLAQARMEGQTIECGICFEECALNRMVRCEAETTHWFCRSCLRTQAETQIGMGRYDLVCMSMDGCSSKFSMEQKALFLDKKLTTALDRIEQETVLRVAGIANLESCPFCPYAAEYPPVEVDKEFRCENPRCRKVSCRLCKKETHIPKTCAEASADRGLDARHIVEEAMSEALIRRCNQCKNPFVKLDGCNKIRCTKCGTIQCDVCRKTIKDYSHFNDTKRGGKTGQCPLFDESENRYIAEVSKVEAETRKKVVEEDPEVVRALKRAEYVIIAVFYLPIFYAFSGFRLDTIGTILIVL